MAEAQTTTKLLIQLGDGATPTENFSTNCSINTNREFTMEATTQDYPNPDCDDPDLPSWVDRVIDTLSAGFSGAGTLDTPSFQIFREWFFSGEPKNIRIKLDVSGGLGGGYFHGLFLITSLTLGKENKGLVTTSMAFQSKRKVAWVDAV